MSTNTPDQQITIPVGTDGALVPTAFNDFVADVETRVVLKYTNLADRTARHTAPLTGDTTDLSAEARTDTWNGSTYVSQASRGMYARQLRTSDAAPINNSAVLVSDATLTVALDVTGTFTFRGRLYYDASTVADIKMAVTVPASTAFKWGLMGRDATTATNITAAIATVSGTAIPAGGNGVGTATFLDYNGYVTTTATGNLVVQYAQNTAEATNLTVRSGSYLEVVKVP